MRTLFTLILTLVTGGIARADYLFTYFTKNGEDGLHLAASTDGYHWEKLNAGRSYLAPTVGQSKLMRDPCVVRGPDGVYHMVWTAGWTENDIGYASTKDFVTWSEQKSIPVMAAEPTVRNTWAPEVAWDDTRAEFIIFWASTVPGKFVETANASESGYNHRLYCTTTKDFVSFTPTRLFYDPGFSVIDATFLTANGRRHLIVKDETRNPPKKYLQIADAESVEGPFGRLSAPFTPPGLWCEGPTAIQIGDDTLVYFDAYQKKHYGAMRSRDLKTWEDVTAEMSFPDEGTPVRMRHGTVIEAPPALVAALRAAPASPSAAAAAAAKPVRERISFDADWRFVKGDPANAGNSLNYATLKPWLLATSAEFLPPTSAKAAMPQANAGAEVAYTLPGFDDSAWRKLDLPHDWGIEGPFDQDNPGETGKLPWWGVAWYRKHFQVPAEDAGKRVYLDVDGAMSHAVVWLNGHCVGGWPYGYASWRVDLTPHLKPGGDNVIAVRLDNPRDSSRWYPGGGIYRHVWLVKTEAVHVAHWGTYVSTPSVTSEQATVDVQVTVQNDSGDAAEVTVGTAVYELDANGRRSGDAVASTPAAATKIAARRQALVARTATVAHPKRWSLRQPRRYVAVTTITRDGQAIDEYETAFGIRTIAFTADHGFLLNGERVMIQGVCDHHDLGALGAALNVRALERQLQLLQEMGCNAIRTSHNPPAPELLELADRLGFVVMDEAFDCWARQKKPNDYHTLFPDWHEQDLRALVRRDRNHPSVVLWSIGNEIGEQGQPEGWKLGQHLAGIVREEDRTRPITAGYNNLDSGYNGFQTVVDAFGYNYKPTEYPKIHASQPQLPLYGSETSSCVSSRGEYFFPVSEDKAEGRANFQVSSYDLYAPRWAWSPDVEFRGLDQAPYTAGEFVWTGFDYLGEPTPYNGDTTNLLNFTDPAQQQKVAQELAALKKIRVPSRSSYFGIIDLAGFKKDRFFLYQARWRPDLAMAHLLPHWTWPERVGQVTPVHVYTSGDEAELFLNGRSLGRKKRGPFEYRLRWDDVKYEPGELHVVAYRQGAKWAEDTVRTAGAATKLLGEADRTTVRADGSDLVFVTVTISDANGTLVPRSHPRVKFEVEGPADVMATDNGDATSFESFQSPERAAYNGLVLAIVRARAGQGGTITVRATSEGLAPVTVNVQSLGPR